MTDMQKYHLPIPEEDRAQPTAVQKAQGGFTSAPVKEVREVTELFLSLR